MIGGHLMLAAAAAAPVSPLLTGLVSYWKLDGNGLDQTGAHNGSVDAGVSFVAGKIGQAATFPVSAKVIRLGDLRSHFTTAATLAIWVKNGSNGTPWLLGGQDGANSDALIESTAYCGVFAATRRVITSAVDMREWHLVCVTQTPGASGWKFWQNGSLVYQDFGDPTVSLPPAAFLGGSDAYFFNGGALDEGGLWNRDLGASGIAEIWNAGAGRTHPFS